ncbi:MAG: hypothetical protein C7B47_17870 [Sulfobacillus thermosulfidooxidans]|uniref:Uncharacterized protein n=1 Tax=Sulfobacillus thermosulfidooxidans TaxID=28034 RepID=A0A2T2WEL4_SULTH|nr:MAG: hypothetical protein C7B47_17870 [Sulfobacillus thermosulfidooxidans]
MARRPHWTIYLYWDARDADLVTWIQTHVPPGQRSAWIKACLRDAMTRTEQMRDSEPSAPGDAATLPALQEAIQVLTRRVAALEAAQGDAPPSDPADASVAWDTATVSAFWASLRPTTDEER